MRENHPSMFRRFVAGARAWLNGITSPECHGFHSLSLCLPHSFGRRSSALITDDAIGSRGREQVQRLTSSTNGSCLEVNESSSSLSFLKDKCEEDFDNQNNRRTGWSVLSVCVSMHCFCEFHVWVFHVLMTMIVIHDWDCAMNVPSHCRWNERPCYFVDDSMMNDVNLRLSGLARHLRHQSDLLFETERERRNWLTVARRPIVASKLNGRRRQSWQRKWPSLNLLRRVEMMMSVAGSVLTVQNFAERVEDYSPCSKLIKDRRTNTWTVTSFTRWMSYDECRVQMSDLVRWLHSHVW